MGWRHGRREKGRNYSCVRSRFSFPPTNLSPSVFPLAIFWSNIYLHQWYLLRNLNVLCQFFVSGPGLGKLIFFRSSPRQVERRFGAHLNTFWILVSLLSCTKEKRPPVSGSLFSLMNKQVTEISKGLLDFPFLILWVWTWIFDFWSKWLFDTFSTSLVYSFNFANAQTFDSNKISLFPLVFSQYTIKWFLRPLNTFEYHWLDDVKHSTVLKFH